MKRLFIFLGLIYLNASCGKLPDVKSDEVLSVVPYPNPAADQVDLYVANDELSAYRMQVFDPNAKLIFEVSVNAGDPKNTFRLDLKTAPKGSYQLVFEKNSTTYYKKFIKI